MGLISGAITVLINESFTTGMFSDLVKQAVITPIHKNDARRLVSNYRLISVLHLLNKLFEKMIAARIIKSAKKFSLLSSCQFDFTRGKSTVDAVLKLVELIYE